jgi:ribosome biogenesis GTPase
VYGERALALIWEGGAQPVVLLTKLDTCADAEMYIEEARAVALGVPVHALSVHAGLGLEALHDHLQPTRTVALIGSSGVGKSTLLNHCLGEERALTSEARAEDDKGRHTTTARELFLLPQGAMLIDTPGMRELGLADADAGLDAAFADIETLAANCRFSDCEHSGEPGCGIEAALQRGELDRARFAAYGKLQRELAYELRRRDERSRQEHQRQQRKIHRQHTRTLRTHPKR